MPVKPQSKREPSAPTSARPTTLMLGNTAVETGSEEVTRMALLLWGAASAGKSTFAATTPGKKLWLTIGDNEHAAVQHRKDVYVANYSGLGLEKFWQDAQNDNPFGLDKFLSENADMDTVVVDSVTAAEYRALQKSVLIDKAGMGKGFIPSMVAPGVAAYGGRNAILLEFLTGILRVTAKHGRHVVLIAHEADPTMKKEGSQEVIDYVGIMLGGKIVNSTTWRLSEIWYMSQRNEQRKLAIRPVRLRRPIKTRMFKVERDPKGNLRSEFALSYDPEKLDKGQKHTIAAWYDQWVAGGYAKIPVPVSATADEE